MKKKYVRILDSSHFKAAPMNNCTWPLSVKKAMAQYNTIEKAEKFALAVIGTATDRREKRCITKALALANVPRGARVLDLPCGAGRLLPLLKKRGYSITAADISIHMLAQASRYTGAFGENCLDETDSFHVANIFQTGFEDDCFDAIVCHRLLHYFPEPEVRQQALRELSRICSGPIVVSFLCNMAADAVASYVKDAIRLRKRHGCAPISYTTFAEDARAVGLVVKKWIPMRPLISKRWFAVVERDTAVRDQTANLCHTIPWRKLGRVASVAAVILIGFFMATHKRAILDPHEHQVEQIVKKYQDGNDHFYVSASSHLEDLSIGKKLSILARVSQADEKIMIDRAESEDSFFLISYKDLTEMENTPVWKQLSFIREVNIGSEKFVLLSTETKGTSTKPRTHESNSRCDRSYAFAKTPCNIRAICETLV